MLPLLDLRNGLNQRPLVRSRKQSTGQFAVTTCRDHPEFFDASVELEDETWEDLSFLDYTPAHYAYYDTLLERFPEYHLCMVDVETRELIATGMCVPLRVAPGSTLPREGWDWLVNTAESQDSKDANTIGALSISVPKKHRDKGLARDMIDTMRSLAAMKGFARVIAPVRPSAKCEHPFVPMEQYVDWVDDRGRIFDPWLRSHVAVGGDVVGVCDRSMVVEQPIDFWKPWVGSHLAQSGNVPVKGALVPVEVDVATGMGRYVEPNVWVSHNV